MTPHPEPPAADGLDRLLLEEGAARPAGRTVVLDDVTGALSLGLDGVVGVWCDSLIDRRMVEVAAERRIPVWDWPEPDLLAGAQRVVARLPKSLAALDELAEWVATYAAPDVTLIAGGRVKHLTRSMNDVLARHFDVVAATRGRYKSRALVASGPLPSSVTYPRRERHDDLGLDVCAHGAVFAGTKVDLGTRFLLSVLSQVPPDAAQVVDLGCGTGILAVAAARLRPDADVRALDVSAAAVRSAAATAAANGLTARVTAEQADGMGDTPPGSVDLVLCNPPFHRGTALDAGTAPALFAEVGRCLRPGGELWTVWNSQLPYLPALRRSVGPTTVVARNPRFTVTRSLRRPRSVR